MLNSGQVSIIHQQSLPLCMAMELRKGLIGMQGKDILD